MVSKAWIVVSFRNDSHVVCTSEDYSQAAHGDAGEDHEPADDGEADAERLPRDAPGHKQRLAHIDNRGDGGGERRGIDCPGVSVAAETSAPPHGRTAEPSHTTPAHARTRFPALTFRKAIVVTANLAVSLPAVGQPFLKTGAPV